MTGMIQSQEYFEVVDLQGRVIKLATRAECHSNPELLHQVVHVLVFNSQGRLYLQKRAMTKDIQPGKWDTSVGGHLQPGEQVEAGAQREMAEELGISQSKLIFLYQYLMKSAVESELVTTYRTVWDHAITPDPAEIAAGRFWEMAEIEAALGQEVFTPNFEDEFIRWKKVRPRV